MTLLSVLRGLLGIILILAIALLFSNNRKRVSWRLVGSGLAIQLTVAVFIIYSETLRGWFRPLGWPMAVIRWLGQAIISLLNFTIEGAKFVFGRLAVNAGPESLGAFFAF